jgi:hypothetical protein
LGPLAALSLVAEIQPELSPLAGHRGTRKLLSENPKLEKLSGSSIINVPPRGSKFNIDFII